MLKNRNIRCNQNYNARARTAYKRLAGLAFVPAWFEFLQVTGHFVTASWSYVLWTSEFEGK